MAKNPNEERDRALEQLKARAEVVRWGKELGRLLALFSFYLDGAEAEAMAGMGYKSLGLDDKTVTRLKNLAQAAQAVTASKVAYDKAEKALGEGLTPEQEREWVRKWIMGMGNVERRSFLVSLLQSHRKRTTLTEPRPGAVMKRQDIETDPEPDDGPPDASN